MGGRYTRLVYIKSVVLEVANWFFLEKSRSRRLRTEENQCVEDERYVLTAKIATAIKSVVHFQL